MEKTFPGIKVFLACKEDSIYLLEGEERIISKEQLNENKNMFAYIRELLCDMQSHPVESFMDESSIPCGPITINESKIGNCVLLTNGIFPVKSLNSNQIKQAIKYIESKGCSVSLNSSTDNAEWIVGVENEYLYQSAANGKKITLIPTGFGENLFKRMFPNTEILHLYA